MFSDASVDPCLVQGGQVNVAYSTSSTDEVNLSFGSARLLLHQQSDTPSFALPGMSPLLTSSSLMPPLSMMAHTAELFGRSALPTSIGPKDPSQYLISLTHQLQLDIVETVSIQPQSGSFTRSFQINGDDLGVLFFLNLTTIYKGSPRCRILANLMDRSGDCVAVLRGPEGSQGCACCCTRCTQSRMTSRTVSRSFFASTCSSRSAVFLNPQESLTVESPPGSVIGHIALHHDFYGVYNKGMLQLLYSVPFKPNSGPDSHTVTAVDASHQHNNNSNNNNNHHHHHHNQSQHQYQPSVAILSGRERGRIYRCTGATGGIKINIRPPHAARSSHHKLLLIATAICMFAMETERTSRPLEWLGCVRLRNCLEETCC